MDQIMKQPQKIVVVGDAFVSPETMEDALRASAVCCGEIRSLFWGTADKQEFTARQLKVERGGPEAVAYAEGLEEAIADADILMTHFNPIPRRLLEKGKHLKLVLTCRGGMEHIDLDAASELGIPVMNVIRNAEPVADFALGMMLCLTRDIALSHARMKQGEWMKSFYNSGFLMTLNSHLVGLAGLGNVGIALARRLKALGVPMIAYDAYTSKERLEKAGLGDITLVSSLEELFERADIVSLHLRLTPETEHSIGAQYFSRMKKTAYFINTARGGLVDQPALAKALQNGDLAGAALDVYDTEPLSPDDPLLQMDNVLLTPHIAGTTVDAIPKSPFLLMREADRFLRDGITDRVVNWASIDRKE
ncbi:MAG: 2-hydroxyacid dehydrogenase [Butyricicoccus pullicaecorum]|nr:2-hydroxyacid dehydrogenase [Butyricicoccus pullicaecorum]